MKEGERACVVVHLKVSETGPVRSTESDRSRQAESTYHAASDCWHQRLEKLGLVNLLNGAKSATSDILVRVLLETVVVGSRSKPEEISRVVQATR